MSFITTRPVLDHHFLAHIPGVFGIKDCNGHDTALTQQCAKMFGFAAPEGFINHRSTGKGLRATTAKLAEDFLAEDQRVSQLKVVIKTLISGIYSNHSISHHYCNLIFINSQQNHG